MRRGIIANPNAIAEPQTHPRSRATVPGSDFKDAMGPGDIAEQPKRVKPAGETSASRQKNTPDVAPSWSGSGPQQA